MSVCSSADSTLRLADAVGASPVAVAPSRLEVRFGGCTPVEWHDRLWAARGVQVVRRGRTLIEKQRPLIYLLVESEELIVFDLDRSSLDPSQHRIVKATIMSQQTYQYAERVESDRDFRFRRVRRHYNSASRPIGECYATVHADLAEGWSTAPDSNAARRHLRNTCGVDGIARASVCGDVFCAQKSKSTLTGVEMFRDGRMLDWLLQHFKDGSPGPEYRSIIPGVFAHPTATIDEHAKLIPPLWIGAGATIQSNATIVGPAVLPDEIAVAPAPIMYCDTVAVRTEKPRQSYSRPGKRMFDIAFSVIALLATAPLFPIIMLLIWLEDGRPYFFPHQRQTCGGRTFTCYKFRTMGKDAENMKASLASQNVCDGPQFHIRHDPRVTRVGRWLRRTHLDELPQFWNVLRGDMHVVGPRPSPDSENQYCPTWREARLSVKPGVTGLWQVSRKRRPQTDFQEWIRYDLEYVRRQNWRLDLAIIFRTVRQIARAALRGSA